MPNQLRTRRLVWKHATPLTVHPRPNGERLPHIAELSPQGSSAAGAIGIAEKLRRRSPNLLWPTPLGHRAWNNWTCQR